MAERKAKAAKLGTRAAVVIRNAQGPQTFTSNKMSNATRQQARASFQWARRMDNEPVTDNDRNGHPAQMGRQRHQHSGNQHNTPAHHNQD